MKASSYLSKVIYTICSIVFLILLWEIISVSMGEEQQILFPRVSVIFKEIGNIFTSGDWVKLLVTLGRTLLLILISFIICFVFGFIYIIFPQSYYFLKPIVNILKAAPFIIISIYIYYIFLGKKTDASVYILGLLVVFPLMYEGFIQSIDGINNDIIDELSLLKVSKFRKFFQVYIPLIGSNIALTLLQSFGLGIKIVVMGEILFNIPNSTGEAIRYGGGAVEQAPMLAWLVLIVILVCLVDLLVIIFNKKRVAKDN